MVTALISFIVAGMAAAVAALTAHRPGTTKTYMTIALICAISGTFTMLFLVHESGL